MPCLSTSELIAAYGINWQTLPGIIILGTYSALQDCNSQCNPCVASEDCVYCWRYSTANEFDWGTLTISDAGSITWQNPEGPDPQDGTYNINGTYNYIQGSPGYFATGNPPSPNPMFQISAGGNSWYVIMGGITSIMYFGGGIYEGFGDLGNSCGEPTVSTLTLSEAFILNLPNGLTVNSPNIITATWQRTTLGTTNYNNCISSGGKYHRVLGSPFSNEEECHFYEKGLCSDPSQASAAGYSNLVTLQETGGRCCDNQCRKPLAPFCPAPNPVCNTNPCGPNCP